MADKATAAVLRLEKVTGTLNIKNKDGNAMNPSEGTKLYAGYTLETKAASHAFISLDGASVVKLEAASRAEIKAAGSKLELAVLSGSMQTNVAVSAANTDGAKIRTSNTSTGIRG